MDKILSMLLIAGIVVLIFLLSYIRERRVQKFSDEFCKAFIEASDHILDVPLNGEKLKYTVNLAADNVNVKLDKKERNKDFIKNSIRLAPLEEQPEALQRLLKKGIDDFVIERFKLMHIKRDGAQLYLSSINMIEKKYNGAMNHIYDVANIFFSALEDFNVLKTEEDINNFHFFLYKQDFIRNTTLASIMSKKAKINC